MNNVIRLLSGESPTSISTQDIFTFISLYPEWLSRMDTSWNDVVQVRNHILQDKELEDSCRSRLLEFFLCDLVYISLTQYKVFEPFVITEGSKIILAKYFKQAIAPSHYQGVSFNFSNSIKGKELSGVAFLLNMLREVIE